jgi:hypothetical protein
VQQFPGDSRVLFLGVNQPPDSYILAVVGAVDPVGPGRRETALQAVSQAFWLHKSTAFFVFSVTPTFDEEPTYFSGCA